MPLRDVNFGLCALLAALSWFVARRERSHRPLAAYLTWMAAGNVLRSLLLDLREGQPRPYTGAARLLFHLEEAMFLSWYFLFAALCLHYFARRRVWPALAAWALALTLCLDYPYVSRDVLVLVYRVVAIGALAASWACIAWAILRRRDLAPGLAHLTVIFYATTDVAANLVPLARGFAANWPLVQIANLLLYSSCCAAHLWWLLRRPAPTAVAAS